VVHGALYYRSFHSAGAPFTAPRLGGDCRVSPATSTAPTALPEHPSAAHFSRISVATSRAHARAPRLRHTTHTLRTHLYRTARVPPWTTSPFALLPSYRGDAHSYTWRAVPKARHSRQEEHWFLPLGQTPWTLRANLARHHTHTPQGGTVRLNGWRAQHFSAVIFRLEVRVGVTGYTWILLRWPSAHGTPDVPVRDDARGARGVPAAIVPTASMGTMVVDRRGRRTRTGLAVNLTAAATTSFTFGSPQPVSQFSAYANVALPFQLLPAFAQLATDICIVYHPSATRAGGAPPALARLARRLTSRSFTRYAWTALVGFGLLACSGNHAGRDTFYTVATRFTAYSQWLPAFAQLHRTGGRVTRLLYWTRWTTLMDTILAGKHLAGLPWTTSATENAISSDAAARYARDSRM